tara:strand:- start:1095 stop:1400 length:306 start_codon:yes stop_codon:yes gene_type:complete
MQKIIKVCPECDSPIRIRDKGSPTEYAYCKPCKAEYFLDELKDKKEIIMSFFDENGKRVYYKHNERSNNKRSLTLKRRNTIKKRAKGLSYRDRNTLKRLRK